MKGYTILGIAGVCLFVFGVAFGWVIFPKVLKSSMHKVSTFRNINIGIILPQFFFKIANFF